MRRREYAVFGLSILPFAMAVLNLRAIGRAPTAIGRTAQGVSVLIPARNESAQITEALNAVLANGRAVREVIVLDDKSSDDTADRVRALADSRVTLIEGSDLPEGWCGKNHACAQLAAAASSPWMLFIDADVRLAADAVSRLLGASSGTDFISGVPRQETRSFFEWLLLPFIDVLLFGYLPLALDKGRASALAAACGQLVFVRRDAYQAVGGHGAVHDRLHDGLALSRAMRRRGFATRLVDATDLASCRMYRNGGEVYAGLMKNATEGLAGPVALPIWTLLLAGGHIFPFLMRASPLVWAARAASIGLRGLVAARCHQGWRTVALSPLGTFLLLFIQFHARLRHLLGRPVTWKGRHYET